MDRKAALVVVLYWVVFSVESVRGGGAATAAAAAAAASGGATYDGRALIINGTRRMLFSGSIHYPRSTPQMWPSLIAKAKQGGLDVIQTYVFWNAHEPVQGQYNFSGRFDLVSFIREVEAQGLYLSLRIGPFIQSEWNYGGLPLWLRDVPGVTYRCDNEPFKYHMQRFVTMIVNLMKSERLFASQGGPIILAQIENEYQNVELAFHERGPPYVRWAASTAVDLKTGVPWIMCKQDDAPDPVINACNGLNCGETFVGPNSPNKPALWSENWTFRYLTYGNDPRPRSAEDLAFSVAFFVANKQGSFVNYYMYHGGTNFGKSASAYVTTSYYDLAPLDEYGLIWLPTWGHLKELHAVIKLMEEPLLWGKHTNYSLGQQQEAHVFRTSSGECAAFLVNFGHTATLRFLNAAYKVPSESISILPGCKQVAFNTAKVNAQYGTRIPKPVQYLNGDQQWGAFAEEVSTVKESSLAATGLLEQTFVTKDGTDYLWYTISYNYSQKDGQQTLHVDSLSHVVHVFVNGEIIGTAHGNPGGGGPVFDNPIPLREGQNDISLLSVMVGIPGAGAYLEKKFFGLQHVRIQGTRNSQDLTDEKWHYKAGLEGERKLLYTWGCSTQATWKPLTGYTNKPLTWYKTIFDAPMGTDPLALNLSRMGKGEVWINGESIGRYWVSFTAPSGRPSQYLYHVPRSFLKQTENLLVLMEEMGGDPRSITLDSIAVRHVCGGVSETNHPTVSFKDKRPRVRLECPQGRRISTILFSSFGTPIGDCSSGYAIGSCHSPASVAIAEQTCLGMKKCSIPVARRIFGDPCPGITKSLLVVAKCR